MGKRSHSSSHSRRRSRSRERSIKDRRSRSRERSPETKKRRSGRHSRRHEDDHHSRHREDSDGRSKRKFVRMDPPPGGWDKPSWEPSGALKKEIKNEEEETSVDIQKKKEEEREKPSFEPSGKLAADTNTFKGVVVKGEESLPVIYVHRQSAYLIGRDHKVVDFPIDHPSCSKQHAALQYRSMPFERIDGSKGRNGERIEPQRYYQLKEKDVLKFGFSSREYVMLHEQSLKGGEDEDTSEEEDIGDIIERSQEDEERIAAAEEDDLF
uniref:FHA domain-containing protein n=1 Tax=Meloidogyne hapla TaxID=6305 RepID=A0A1I8B9Q7_MELHA